LSRFSGESSGPVSRIVAESMTPTLAWLVLP
jgi:hypothetical protein